MPGPKKKKRTICAQTVLVYIQDNVGFALGYGIPTIGLVVSILVFLLGTPLYRHRLPSGSPLTRMVQVFVASLRKWKLNAPGDPKELHELSTEEYASKGRNRISHSSSLRLYKSLATFYPFKFHCICHKNLYKWINCINI